MLWKKVTLLSLAGFVIGSLIGTAFILIGGSSKGIAADLPHILLGGLYGAAAMGSSVVYEIEKWSIARATATHFLCTFALYFLLSLSLGWFRPEEPLFWIVIGVMTAAYLLIWLFQYLAYKRTIQKMNDDLKKWKSGKNAD